MNPVCHVLYYKYKHTYSHRAISDHYHPLSSSTPLLPDWKRKKIHTSTLSPLSWFGSDRGICRAGVTEVSVALPTRLRTAGIFVQQRMTIDSQIGDPVPAFPTTSEVQEYVQLQFWCCGHRDCERVLVVGRDGCVNTHTGACGSCPCRSRPLRLCVPADPVPAPITWRLLLIITFKRILPM